MSCGLDGGARRGHLAHSTTVFPERPPMTSAAQPSADLSFPTGRFQRPASLDADARARAIETVAATPARLREAVRGLTARQIDTPYRPGGWTVRQVVHHVP